MIIWLIDHYSVPVRYYPLARQTTFAKYLQRMGHEVIIFAASSVHNSDINLVEKNKKYEEMIEDDVRYVLIGCHQYQGNGVKRILNMMEFANKLTKVCTKFDKPDAIISTSMTLFACKKGLELSKKYGCKKIAQITDLWPESIVAYGIAKKHNPLVRILRILEKNIYKSADKIIFSMEGAYDYIIEQGWENIIARDKVICINNGVDLEVFKYNRDTYHIDDLDLEDRNHFKVVYTGSIRKVNNLGKILEIAKKIKNKSVIFLIWGEGDELASLQKQVKIENINNVIFKGKVDKKYIPFIVSKADLNIAHNTSSPLFRFGISFNKLFDYFAAGKPILCDFECKYNPMVTTKSGVAVESGKVQDIADMIDEILQMERSQYQLYCENAVFASERYDFAKLTQELLKVIVE